MDKRRVIDITVEEFNNNMRSLLEERERKETVTTDQLREILNCSEAQIGIYGRAGMKKAARIKKNCWDPNKCIKWVSEEWQKILASGKPKK